METNLNYPRRLADTLVAGLGFEAARDFARENDWDGVPSGLYQLNCTPTIAFPVSSVGGEVPAMRGHRQAFPTPRGDGKSDPKGGVSRLPDVVARRLWCTHTAARRAPSRKPRNAVVGVQFS